MNKTQLVDALAARLGDRRTAAAAVDGLLQTIVDTVRSGGSVTIPGFGVFEGRSRAARVGRNPRTGEPIDVPAMTVPAFRPGAGFREAVGGSVPAAHSRARTVSAVAEPVASFAAEPAPAKAGKAAKAGRTKGPKGKADKPKKGKKK